MLLNKELERWATKDTKYITRVYLILNHSEKENIELRYKYEREDVTIQRKVNAGIGIDENLSEVALDSFLNDYNQRFHKLIADHIEENWEQKIFENNPDRSDAFDIAYYSTNTEPTQRPATSIGKLIITKGRRVGEHIISVDDFINVEVEEGRMSIIGWNHL